ncbi:Flp pilus assembly protein CpaB [Pseudomonas ovata]|uniref:Flp pilus assembly protein CpaB n=1 Tax=Pseudomonas ovata TaxID=1839709 RepID=UPI000D697269|nr:Flp pilus assembly protein CpaB [Pseudomonas ovata]
MSSRATLILASLFLLGAILVGYLGVMVSTPATPEPAPVAVVAPPSAPVAPLPVAEKAEDALRQSVLVLARDLPAYTVIKAEDLTVERLKIAPPGSLTTFDQAVGRSTWRTLAAGTWLTEDSFEAGGSLARMIRADERALAVAVDEVAGAAGHITPGDYVDVLLYLPSDTENAQRSTQVVVPALRVLSIGELLGPTLDGSPAQPLSADERLKQEQRRASARTVVLAVPEPLLGRLMLATQNGVLRLAVRSAEEKYLQDYWAAEAGSRDVALRLDTANRSLVRFAQLTLAGPGGRTTAPAAARPIEVIRGNQAGQPAP